MNQYEQRGEVSLSIQNTKSKQFTLPQNVNGKYLNEKKGKILKQKKILKNEISFQTHTRQNR